MAHFIEQLIVLIRNLLRKRVPRARPEYGTFNLGLRVIDEQVSSRRFALSSSRRATHIAVLGKTGTGKSSFIRYLSLQDIEAGRGFLYFDIHGDATPFLLRAIRHEELRRNEQLHDKLILIDPADPLVSVGLNPFQTEAPDFAQIMGFAGTLRERWSLDHFGARTEELLRNSLYLLAANGLTLLELSLVLTNSQFRTLCLNNVHNDEIRSYFESRYDQVSEAMRGTMREPILNKISAFTADPHFRHIVGQARSTFSLTEAMDQGQWVIVNLAKGKLGEQSLTLGSLIFSMCKGALFSRSKRSLFTLYCDEVQNLVSYGSGLETVLSEARKFGVAVISANQFLDQYPPEMRSAILSVGCHAFFQLSTADAAPISQALDGGRPLAERLKNLEQRRAIVKSGAERWTEIAVPNVRDHQIDYTDLLNRSRLKWGRVRTHIEREIRERHAVARGNKKEALHGWD